MRRRVHRPATKAELIARLPRALRPRLQRGQMLDLAAAEVGHKTHNVGGNRLAPTKE